MRLGRNRIATGVSYLVAHLDQQPLRFVAALDALQCIATPDLLAVKSDLDQAIRQAFGH